MDSATKQQIETVITSNKVVLFMKGNRHFPQCGFSSKVKDILEDVGAKYETVNVLQDAAIRDGIKEFSSWPTIPQLYVDGQFVGGCDIVTQMHASGELATLLGGTVEPVKPPTITITDGAAKAFKDADDGGADKLRIEIAPDFATDLFFDAPNANDIVVVANGIEVRLDGKSAKRANGMTIDFVTGERGGAFKIENPNAPARVKAMSAAELAKKIADGPVELYDVRPATERAVASIPEAKPLDETAIRALPKDTTIVFHCHHGPRSRAVAQQYVDAGYTNVYNLEGGIEAYAAVVPSIPRY